MSAALSAMHSLPHTPPYLVPSGLRGPGAARELHPQLLAPMRAGHLMSQLPPAVQQAVLDAARVSRVSAGAILGRRAEPARYCVGVVSGAVRVGTVLHDGRVMALDILAPGQWFGDIALIDGRAQEVDMVAQMPSLLLMLDAAELKRLMAEHRALGDALMRLNCERLRHLHRRFEDMHALSLPQRVARQLLRLAKRFGREQDGLVHLELHLSQSDLAALTGGSRQRINLALGQMQARGLLQVGAARLTLLDCTRLHALAQGRLRLASGH